MTQQSADNNDEDRLIALARTDREAMGRLYDAWYAPIYSYCLRRLFVSDFAEDVTATVFLQVAAGIRTFRGGGAGFRAWLYAIASNAVNAHLRQSHRRQRVMEEATRAGRFNERHEDPSHRAAQREAWARTYLAISELSELDQTIVTLRFLQGLEMAEVAAVVGLKPGAARTRLCRALERLRTRLGEPPPERQGETT
ncbi:MAG: RNA polymerase sigma factor SigY [Planctomycetes bacterium ADurb.Bin126]|nr:MAG: RNA polymerase sigma factor SigY [Planctomycetes bacterium ADurb.Bin126]HOD84792.1 sigma-70 family RNA polymerase sigma factor [Phycisphaerae bacterium]HQL74250.1 sigma-70 family RNA polymerase sigma factor [Phycisphaerae bacterium]